MSDEHEFDELISAAKKDERACATRLAELQRNKAQHLTGGKLQMSRAFTSARGGQEVRQIEGAELEIELNSLIKNAEAAWNAAKQRVNWAEGLKRLPPVIREQRLRQHREQEANKARHEGKPQVSEHEKLVRDANERRRQEMLAEQEANRQRRQGGAPVHGPAASVPGVPVAPWETRRQEMLAEQEANRRRRQGG